MFTKDYIHWSAFPRWLQHTHLLRMLALGSRLFVGSPARLLRTLQPPFQRQLAPASRVKLLA
jgi:hypothetical protein